MRALFLTLTLLIAALLAACAGSEAAPSAPRASVWEGTMEGLYRETDRQGPYRLLEGAREAFGTQLPDGRVWLHDLEKDSYRLLTPTAAFGERFFASGGLFLNEDAVLVKVNFDDDADNLYRISLEDGEAAFVVDADALGLVSIEDRNWQFSARAGVLEFVGERLLDLPDAPDGWALERSRYRLALDAPDVSASLERLGGVGWR